MEILISENSRIAKSKEVSDSVKADTTTLVKTNSPDLSERPLTRFNIFPNPSSSIIFTNGTPNIISYDLYDLTGKLIQIISSQELQSGYDISSLKNGLYLLYANDINKIKISASKLIVQ